MLKTAKNETKAFPTRRISIMQMTLRWYGSKYDTVTLKQIRQIPGVTGVISTLYGTAPGEVWEMDDILALKTEIEAAGLQLAGIESVNIHDAIKIGSPDREQYRVGDSFDTACISLLMSSPSSSTYSASSSVRIVYVFP